MVQHFVEFLPTDGVSTLAAVLLALGSAAGTVLWLCGVRFSRFLTTLLAVLIGAVLGTQLPRWFGWNVAGAGTAVGAALVLGVSGYVLHGMWTGLLLGAWLSLWAFFATWILTSNGTAMTWPECDQATTLSSWCVEWWQALPASTTRYLPFTTAAAMISGLASAILWPRLTSAMSWALGGATMMTTLGLSAVWLSRPQWIVDGPIPNTQIQAVIFTATVLLGTAFQWRLARPAARAGSKGNGKDDEGPAPQEAD